MEFPKKVREPGTVKISINRVQHTSICQDMISRSESAGYGCHLHGKDAMQLTRPVAILQTNMYEGSPESMKQFRISREPTLL
jgi:hypothetical protein